MMRKMLVPPFGRIFSTSLILSILGLGGLAFIIFLLEPTLGPRWMFFFFLTISGTGIALPLVYLIQRRIASHYVPPSVLIREALLFGVFLAILAWLQIGRITSDLIILLLAGGLVLFEVFLRMAEKATFKPDEYADD